jgi:hypothetical protein
MRHHAAILVWFLGLVGLPCPAAEKSRPEPAATDHWAFRPPRTLQVPQVRQTGWPRNAIDAFILARLEKDGVRPAAVADRLILLRRLCLDLLGLPPSPAEARAFLEDRRPGAYERLVDRLLASQAYGERWGRHWLDLARYADSDGFEKDRERPHAWRYRQWVIDAHNRDLPYDRFVIEQIAGDLLSEASAEARAATGFHRNALTNDEDGVDKEQFRVEQTVDRTNTTATVFLGITLACAQCHDHKYDPFSQKDYYRFFAFFNSLVDRDLPAPLAWEADAYRKAQAAFDRKKAELEGGLAEFQRNQLPANQRQWEKDLTASEMKLLPARVRAALAVPAPRRGRRQKAVVDEYYAGIDPTLEILKGLVEDHFKQAPRASMAQTVAEGKKRPTHVLRRGDFLRPAARVEADVPAVLGRLKEARNHHRLALAQWLVRPDNPLTARVEVNRLWQHHFGQGLVRTPEDLGTQGEAPTHPELLDWLSTELTRRQWSLKAMHRLIVCSATYRQSSAFRPELADRDPSNQWLARQNRLRLEAEIIHDEALTAGGLLTRRIGGPSVRPPQPDGVAEITFLGQERWVPSQGPDRYRRGLYTFFRRTSPYPSLMTFDAPDSSLACTRRTRTNTPLQALVLLNDPCFVEAAQALARRVLREGGRTSADRIRHAFRLCLGRDSTARETRRLAGLLDASRKRLETDRQAAEDLAGKADLPPWTGVVETAAWVAVGRILMNLDEFITRE